MNRNDNPYEILGLPFMESDEAAIKKAFHRAALRYHPDRQMTDNDKEVASKIFPKLSAAYDTLMDPRKLEQWKDSIAKKQQRQEKEDSKRSERTSTAHNSYAFSTSSATSSGSFAEMALGPKPSRDSPLSVQQKRPQHRNHNQSNPHHHPASPSKTRWSFPSGMYNNQKSKEQREAELVMQQQRWSSQINGKNGKLNGSGNSNESSSGELTNGRTSSGRFDQPPKSPRRQHGSSHHTPSSPRGGQRPVNPSENQSPRRQRQPVQVGGPPPPPASPRSPRQRRESIRGASASPRRRRSVVGGSAVGGGTVPAPPASPRQGLRNGELHIGSAPARSSSPKPRRQRRTSMGPPPREFSWQRNKSKQQLLEEEKKKEQEAEQQRRLAQRPTSPNTPSMTSFDATTVQVHHHSPDGGADEDRQNSKDYNSKTRGNKNSVGNNNTNNNSSNDGEDKNNGDDKVENDPPSTIFASKRWFGKNNKKDPKDSNNNHQDASTTTSHTAATTATTATTGPYTSNGDSDIYQSPVVRRSSVANRPPSPTAALLFGNDINNKSYRNIRQKKDDANDVNHNSAGSFNFSPRKRRSSIPGATHNPNNIAPEHVPVSNTKVQYYGGGRPHNEYRAAEQEQLSSSQRRAAGQHKHKGSGDKNFNKSWPAPKQDDSSSRRGHRRSVGAESTRYVTKEKPQFVPAKMTRDMERRQEKLDRKQQKKEEKKLKKQLQQQQQNEENDANTKPSRSLSEPPGSPARRRSLRRASIVGRPPPSPRPGNTDSPTALSPGGSQRKRRFSMPGSMHFRASTKNVSPEAEQEKGDKEVQDKEHPPSGFKDASHRSSNYGGVDTSVRTDTTTPVHENSSVEPDQKREDLRAPKPTMRANTGSRDTGQGRDESEKEKLEKKQLKKDEKKLKKQQKGSGRGRSFAPPRRQRSKSEPPRSKGGRSRRAALLGRSSPAESAVDTVPDTPKVQDDQQAAPPASAPNSPIGGSQRKKHFGIPGSGYFRSSSRKKVEQQQQQRDASSIRDTSSTSDFIDTSYRGAVQPQYAKEYIGPSSPTQESSSSPTNDGIAKDESIKTNGEDLRAPKPTSHMKYERAPPSPGGKMTRDMERRQERLDRKNEKKQQRKEEKKLKKLQQQSNDKDGSTSSRRRSKSEPPKALNKGRWRPSSILGRSSKAVNGNSKDGDKDNKQQQRPNSRGRPPAADGGDKKHKKSRSNSRSSRRQRRLHHQQQKPEDVNNKDHSHRNGSRGSSEPPVMKPQPGKQVEGGDTKGSPTSSVVPSSRDSTPVRSGGRPPTADGKSGDGRHTKKSKIRSKEGDKRRSDKSPHGGHRRGKSEPPVVGNAATKSPRGRDGAAATPGNKGDNNKKKSRSKSRTNDKTGKAQGAWDGSRRGSSVPPPKSPIQRFFKKTLSSPPGGKVPNNDDNSHQHPGTMTQGRDNIQQRQQQQQRRASVGGESGTGPSYHNYYGGPKEHNLRAPNTVATEKPRYGGASGDGGGPTPAFPPPPPLFDGGLASSSASTSGASTKTSKSGKTGSSTDQTSNQTNNRRTTHGRDDSRRTTKPPISPKPRNGSNGAGFSSAKHYSAPSASYRKQSPSSYRQ